MQILINKSGRSVRLNKRERDLLKSAADLSAEISSVTKHETAEAFDAASAELHRGLVLIDATDPTEAEKVA